MKQQPDDNQRTVSNQQAESTENHRESNGGKVERGSSPRSRRESEHADFSEKKVALENEISDTEKSAVFEIDLESKRAGADEKIQELERGAWRFAGGVKRKNHRKKRWGIGRTTKTGGRKNPQTQRAAGGIDSTATIGELGNFFFFKRKRWWLNLNRGTACYREEPGIKRDANRFTEQGRP
jgi:hypothetical protein